MNETPSVMPCPDCGGAPCACVLKARVAGAERRESAAVAEAYQYRELWEAAASCLQHNRAQITPRGADERRMLDAAHACMCGHFWSGHTDGWLGEAQQMKLFDE